MNNNEETNGNTNDAANLFEPTITINIPIKTTQAKLEEVLEVLGFDAQLPPMEQINQINLQISIENGGKNNAQS